MYLFEKSSVLLDIDHTNKVCSNDARWKVYQYCKLIIPVRVAEVCLLGRGHLKSYIENIISFKIFLSTPGHSHIDQTNWVYGNYELGRVYQKLHDAFRGGLISCIIMMTGTCINIHYVDCYRLKGYNAAFFGHCYDRPVDMHISTLLTKSRCRFCVIQVTIKARESLNF